ncbi:hypothetical protein BESB_064460 [Besnoitia besnoiti]|uniref:EF-hand domain-containing protein n=1 Tax=Besnoitia besnoiti TaxID=94643 RepID=A0A2A9M8W1_BESBE|nr:hypothetical protein BESB_064460 [Besnoitia besnoiti]PFH34415.1 hypothetical protein BESB_064460 [Besnoitia besnoiti]
MGEGNPCAENRRRCRASGPGAASCAERPTEGHGPIGLSRDDRKLPFSASQEPSVPPPGGCGSAAPETLLQALKMLSQRPPFADFGVRSTPFSLKSGSRGDATGQAPRARGRSRPLANESRGEPDEDAAQACGESQSRETSEQPHGGGARTGPKGVAAAFAGRASSPACSRRSPRGIGGFLGAHGCSNASSAWLDDVMVPFLCDSRVRRFILQTKSLADQNEPEKVGTLFERALQAYQATSSSAFTAAFSPLDSSAGASPFHSSLPSASSPVPTGALSASSFPGFSPAFAGAAGGLGGGVSPSYLRRPVDVVPNPKRPASASSPLADRVARKFPQVKPAASSSDSLPTLTQDEGEGPRGGAAVARSSDKTKKSSPAAAEDAERETLEERQEADGFPAGHALLGEEGDEESPPLSRRTETDAGDFRSIPVQGGETGGRVSAEDEEERSGAASEAEDPSRKAKRKKEETSRQAIGTEDPASDGGVPQPQGERSTAVAAPDHAREEEMPEGEAKTSRASPTSRSKRKIEAREDNVAAGPPPARKEPPAAKTSLDSDASLSLRDYIIRQHKMLNVKPAAKVTGEALAALEEVFGRHPDGISDPNVFAEEVVVPLLGLGEYMSSRLFGMVDRHDTGTVSLPMMKEFWANRLVLASEDPTTIDEGFPSAKLPVFLLPASASDDGSRRPSLFVNEDVVPHVVKRGSARNFFNVVKQDGADAITADDLRPWVEEVLRQAPDMAFLNEPSAAEFAARYVDSVITRIMFEVDTEDTGRVSLKALKHSCLPHVWFTLRPGVELSVIRRFFSYEHFYVFYCTFHALDEDEDFLLDRSDVRRHDTHNMNIEVEERLFLQVARPFRSPKTGYMCFEDWIWFLLVYHDVTSERAIQFWFKIFDIDGDGVLRDHEIEVFFNAQVDRFRLRDDKLPTYRDFICPMCDALRVPYASGLRCRDLLRDPVCGGCFINCLLKRAAFQAMDEGESMTSIAKGSPWDRQLIELTPFEIFASQQYQELTARKGEECFIDESSSFLDESEGSQSDESLVTEGGSAESIEV